MRHRTLLPVAVALAIAFIAGVASWLPHAKQVQIIANLAGCACCLWWVMMDASVRKVSVGNWVGILVLLVQPLGMLIWFTTRWRWRFYRPFGVYLACLLAWTLCGILGFLVGGWANGFATAELVELLGW